MEVNQWSKISAKLHADLLDQALLIFPVLLISNKWSLFVAVALPDVGKKTLKMPMLCHLDPIGSHDEDTAITIMSEKIRQLLNVMWQNKFRLKVDKIDNPYNKRSLPLRCFKGEPKYRLCIFLFVWIFIQIRKIPANIITVHSFAIDD